jgi:phenylacetate-coenzyme A ligase PaaK-like adenylate-forming protein
VTPHRSTHASPVPSARADAAEQMAPPFSISIYERLSGRRPWSEMRRLQSLQWETADQLETLGMRRLRQLLEHAVAHVPYYRRLFAEAGIRPGDIRSPADLACLPTTSKLDLRVRFPEQVVAPHLVRRGHRTSTSGSTGVPFEFFADRSAQERVLGSYLFFRHWAGASLGLSVVYVSTGLMYSLPSIARTSAVRQAARRLLLGERLLRLSGIELDPRALQRHIGRLPAHHGFFLLGFPSYIAHVAAALVESGLELPSYPRLVLCYAESLTAADATIIERAFRAPVVNHYSAQEMPHLAQSCPDNPTLLHVNSERAIVRVVRSDGRPAEVGETGDVVLTDLWNEVMPLINYAIGDRAAPGGPCPCGRGFATLARIEGRASELIRTPSGRIISPTTLGSFILCLCEGLPYVWEYQAVQTSADAVVLRIVPTPRFDPEIGRRMRDSFEAFLGPGVSANVETVDRIPAEPSGKRMIIKSRLPVPSVTP